MSTNQCLSTITHPPTQAKSLFLPQPPNPPTPPPSFQRAAVLHPSAGVGGMYRKSEELWSRCPGSRGKFHSHCVSPWLHLSVVQHRWSYLNVRWNPSVADNARSVHSAVAQPFCFNTRPVVDSAENQTPHPRKTFLLSLEGMKSLVLEKICSIATSYLTFLLPQNGPSAVVCFREQTYRGITCYRVFRGRA